MIRLEVPESIRSSRVVAIARRVPFDRLQGVADVLADVGITVLEVTLDGDDALDSIRRLSGGPLTIGAGTVRSIPEAVAAERAGAEFIVMPHTDADIVRAVTARGVPVMPGALTPTEAVTAWNLGASAVKLFPAAFGGPRYLRSLKAPLTDVSFLPTGGIDDSNAAEYLDAGAVAVGVGAWLTGGSDLAVIRERGASLVSVTR